MLFDKQSSNSQCVSNCSTIIDQGRNRTVAIIQSSWLRRKISAFGAQSPPPDEGPGKTVFHLTANDLDTYVSRTLSHRTVARLSRHGYWQEASKSILLDLHWLSSPSKQWVQLATLVYRCLYGSASSYLADKLLLVADVESRQRLPSSSSDALVIPPTAWHVSDHAPCCRCSCLERTSSTRHLNPLAAHFQSVGLSVGEIYWPILKESIAVGRTQWCHGL